MDFTRYLKKNLEDPEFRKEWDALEAETQIMRSMIEARLEAGMTRRSSFPRRQESSIPRSIGSKAVLERIAAPLGKRLSISFI